MAALGELYLSTVFILGRVRIQAGETDQGQTTKGLLVQAKNDHTSSSSGEYCKGWGHRLGEGFGNNCITKNKSPK